MMNAIQQPIQLRLALAWSSLLCLLGWWPAHAGPLISNINTDKAMYAPGAAVTLYVDLQNAMGSNFTGTAEVSITHLGSLVTNLPAQGVSLTVGATATKVFSWSTPATDYRGYLVSVAVKNGGGMAVDSGSSAIDVSTDWSRFPRYGYVSQFGAGLDAGNIAWQLKNYHLNGLQFYDWQWKHHVPYSSAASWPDIANRAISRATVSNLINAAHSYGMMAMNYNLYGGAYSNYLTDGSGVTLSMGIFSGAPASQANQLNHSLPGGWATSRLFTMNNRDTGWQNYIFGREQTVFSNFGFDGWHIDALGQHNAYDYAGNAFNLDDYNAVFINSAKATLNKRMLFNSVDAVGESQVARDANVDFVYSELWSANENYIDFKTRVDNVRSQGSKAVVFPAYMNRSKTSGFFNDASVRLTDAAIFACGGSHLELGDGGEMLRTEYFPENTVKMSTALKSALRNYYDFLVGYQNLLRGDTVSASHQATITGVATSTNGSAGKVWVISRTTLGHDMIHLVNLLNNTSTQWRDTNGTYAVPTTLNNLAVKMYYTGPLGGGKLRWASPDINFGAAAELTYAPGSDAGGSYLTFTLPQLQYWDMIWLENNGTVGATSTFQAENFDSMAGIGTEVTSDVGGGLNVGFVSDIAGDSYVAFHNVDFGAGVSSVSARVASATANGTVEFRLGSPTGLLIATLPVGNTGGWQTWQTISAPVAGASGVQRVFVVFKNSAVNLNWFTFVAPLPAPWVAADIGSVGVGGGAAYSGGTFTVTGSGADIEGSADAFRYVYQPSSGDCEIRARVVSLQNTDPWAKAGVMFRESAAPGAINVAVLVTPGNGVAFQRRTATGGGTTSTVVGGITPPRWVRLVRSANDSFLAYHSADAVNWTQIGATATLPMSSTVSAGLAVTAHNNATTCAAVFDGVTVNQAPTLAALSNQTLVAGQTLSVTNAASDADVPVQVLTYSLLGTPSGASIDTNTGVLTWRPTIAQSPSAPTIEVVVSDNGTPPMSATQNCVVTVNQPVPPTLDGFVKTNGQFGFRVSGDTGPDYVILTSTNLATWKPVVTNNAPTPPFFWMDSGSGDGAALFYRILLGP